MRDERSGFLEDQVSLTLRQLAAVSAWQERQRALAEAAGIRAEAQHQRQELSARLEVARVEHAAIVERSRLALARSAELVSGRRRARLLLAHGDTATVAAVQQWLVPRGIDVIGACADGAEAVGVAVAECPDVVLVGFPLRRLTCLDVVRQISELCPGTLVAAQAPTIASRKILAESGAQWVCSSELSGPALAAGLHELLPSH